MDELTTTMIDFVRGIGLPVQLGPVADDAILPGLDLASGGLVIDLQRLRYPGDILHEAGHLAVIPATRRGQIHGRLDADGGEELGAIAWSYAAALHLGIDAAVLFHPQGYKHGADALLENFRDGRYLGLPYLQWLGLTLEPARAAQLGQRPYPHMQRWMCE